MRRRFLALWAVMTVAAAACSSPSHRADPPATLSPAPTTTAAPAGPNPDVVPTVITPAYVDAVFKVLNHINGDAVRELERSHSLDSAVLADLKAIYGGPLLSIEKQVFQAGLAEDTSNLRHPIGDRITTVLSLISSNGQCVFVETRSNLSAVEIRPTAEPASEYWALKPKAANQDPHGINPTPWSLDYNQDFTTPITVPNQCSG